MFFSLKKLALPPVDKISIPLEESSLPSIAKFVLSKTEIRARLIFTFSVFNFGFSNILFIGYKVNSFYERFPF